MQKLKYEHDLKTIFFDISSWRTLKRIIVGIPHCYSQRHKAGRDDRLI
jgi:hypothetical protein